MAVEEIITDSIAFEKEGKGGVTTFFNEVTSRSAFNYVDLELFKKSDRFVEALPLFFKKRWYVLKGLFLFRSFFLYLRLRKKRGIFYSSDLINPLFPIKHLVCVTTIHDLVFWKNVGIKKNIIFFDKKISILHAVRISRFIITVSETSRDDLVKTLEVDVERIVIAPNGLRTNFKKVSYPRARERHCSTEIIQMVFVGSRNPYKNLKLALDVVKVGLDKNVGVNLTVVGSYPHLSENELRYCRFLGIQDRVVFSGPISDHKLIGIYLASDFLITPSRWEGFNIPVIEALSFGCGVIASDIPIHREHYSRFPSITLLDDIDDPEASYALIVEEFKKSRKAVEDLRPFVESVYNYNEAARRIDKVFKTINAESFSK